MLHTAIKNCEYMEKLNKDGKASQQNPMTRVYKIVDGLKEYLEWFLHIKHISKKWAKTFTANFRTNQEFTFKLKYWYKYLHRTLKKAQNNDKIMIIKTRSDYMINIRPVSDLRNKYPEIEELVLKEDEEVYLTKNGYGSMVVMSIEKYSKLISDLEYNEYIENELDEADREAEDPNAKYYTHEEMIQIARRIIDGE